MSDASDPNLAIVAQGHPESVRWQNWPVRDDALRALLVWVGLLLAAVAVRWCTGQTHLALMAAGALMLASWRFFVPVVFEVGELGIDRWVLHQHRFTAWQAIRRHEVGPDGVLLFPDEDPGAMAAFRSFYLPWGAHREEVLAWVRRYLGPAQESS